MSTTYALEQVSQKIGNKEREPLHTSFQESVHTPSSMYILSNCLIDRVYKYGKTIAEIILKCRDSIILNTNFFLDLLGLPG